MRTLIAIPTFNERDNLPLLLDSILKISPQADILVIDDDSPDGTGKIADDFASKSSQIHVIHRPYKSGRGSASVSGYKFSIENKYDYYMEMDCDFSHSPEELPLFFSKMGSSDIVIGSRFLDGSVINGWSVYRKVLHFSADFFIQIILGLRITDPTNGYHCYPVKMLSCVDFNKLKSDGYVAHTLLKALLSRAGCRIIEIPSIFLNRQRGKSKMNVGEAFFGVLDMISFRFNLMWHGKDYFLNVNR